MAKINKYNALERILDIINTLCERNRITIKELANRYGFSTDIIIEDLNYINNTEMLDLTLLPEDSSYDYEDDEDDDFTEQLKRWDKLDIPITAFRYVGNKDPKMLSLQISEVEKLFLKSFLNESETYGDILIKDAHEYASKERVEILCRLDKAIKNKETLKVDYDDKEEDLVITPLHIVRMISDNLYYCMADCSGNIRYFRTDKLSVVEVVRQDRGISQEKIDREIELLDLRWGVDDEEPFDFEMVVYNEADLPRRLKIELKNRKNAVWEELPDGKWLYKDKVIDFKSLKTWVLGLGKSVKVLKPQKMADEILADAKKRYEYYRQFFEVAENESSQPEERGKAD